MALTGEIEAWDGPWYWMVTFPVLIVASAAMGYRAPGRPWLWALGLVAPVPLLNQLHWPSGAGEFVLGVVASLVVSIPLIVCAWLGAFVRRRKDRRATSEA